MLDEVSNEGKIGITGSWIRDFYLLEATFYEQSEEGEFLIASHGICKGLVSITEIGGQPDGRLEKRFGWPCAAD
jgi:hypothetical protein